MNILQSIHSQVNSKALYRHERLGRDEWKTPKELYKSGEGDCEDFAIAYWKELIECGYKPLPEVACLLFVGGRELHMVCLVDGWVLDVLSDVVYRLSDREDLGGVLYTLSIEDDVPVMKVRGQVLEAPLKWKKTIERMNREAGK